MTTVAIITTEDDIHAHSVMRHLEARRCDARIVNAASLADTSRLSQSLGRDRAVEWTTPRGDRVRLDASTTVWYRRMHEPLLPEELRDGAERSFVRREWSHFISGALSSLDVPLVNDPHRQRAATKPQQLTLAQALGWRIPETTITNDAEVVRAFVARHHGRVVHKTLTAPRHRLLVTRRWSAADEAALATLALAPSIFQEAIEDATELRITVVGERIFAAEFSPRAELVDGRLDLETPYRAHELPDEVAARIHALVGRLGLVYSTLDLKRTRDGEYLFLELNPQGQFLYVEMLTGLAISAAMADLLATSAST